MNAPIVSQRYSVIVKIIYKDLIHLLYTYMEAVNTPSVSYNMTFDTPYFVIERCSLLIMNSYQTTYDNNAVGSKLYLYVVNIKISKVIYVCVESEQIT